jgi:hypothetical protein
MADLNTADRALLSCLLNEVDRLTDRIADPAHGDVVPTASARNEGELRGIRVALALMTGTHDINVPEVTFRKRLPFLRRIADGREA